MDSQLYYFSLMFLIIQLALVFVPYMLKKRDLINAWSLFCIGAACFVGLSGISAATQPRGYVDNTPMDYWLYFAGVVVFFITVSVVYYFFKWPSTIAMKRFKKWPPITPNTLFVMILVGFIMSMGMLFPIPVQGIGQFASLVGKNGVVLMGIAAFVYWLRHPYNPLIMIFLLIVFSYGFGVSVLGGSGRRDMVAVLSVIPIVLYWLVFRNASSTKTTLVILSIAIPAVLVINGYSVVRHEFRNAGNKDFTSIVDMARKIPGNMLNPNGAAQMLGQNATEVSLLSIHVYHTEEWVGFEQEPFYTVKYIALNPIPRAFWPNKPESLGVILPKYTKLAGGTENWGPGIVGHGYHEGGLHMLVFYGVVAGILLRLFDTLLCVHPGNPFLLAILAANSGQIIGWTRGDIGGFSVLIIAGIIAVWIVVRLLRYFCGTEPVQMHSHETAPVL